MGLPFLKKIKKVLTKMARDDNIKKFRKTTKNVENKKTKKSLTKVFEHDKL